MRTAVDDKAVVLPARPAARDPFELVEEDLSLIKQKLKKMAEDNLSSGEKQVGAATKGLGGVGGLGWKNLFERPEKAWRPVAIVLVAQMLRGMRSETQQQLDKSSYLALAEIIEIMHLSTQIHDTVLEDNDDLEKGNAAHRMYSSSVAGNKVSILVGDALLSRASVLSASLRHPIVVELVAGALESLMIGQMQIHRPTRDQPRLNAYIQNVHLRSGNLLGKGCEALAVLAGRSMDDPITKASSGYGMNLGVAYQMLKDLEVTEANYAKVLKKISLESKTSEGVRYTPDELNEPLERAGPLLYAAVLFPELEDMARRGFRNVTELLHARSLIERCDAVEGIRRLAQYHAQQALDALDVFEDSEQKKSLQLLAHYMLDEGQARLLKKNYMNGKYDAASSSSGGEHVSVAEKKAKAENYVRLDRLYGQAWKGVEFVKDTVVQSVRGLKVRASKDIRQLHKSAVRDAVLYYGKGVDVDTVHHYIHAQCAFKVSAQDLEEMLHHEIQWQLRNGVETMADVVALAHQESGEAVQGTQPVLAPQRIVDNHKQQY